MDSCLSCLTPYLAPNSSSSAEADDSMNDTRNVMFKLCTSSYCLNFVHSSYSIRQFSPVPIKLVLIGFQSECRITIIDPDRQAFERMSGRVETPQVTYGIYLMKLCLAMPQSATNAKPWHRHQAKSLSPQVRRFIFSSRALAVAPQSAPDAITLLRYLLNSDLASWPLVLFISTCITHSSMVRTSSLNIVAADLDGRCFPAVAP